MATTKKILAAGAGKKSNPKAPDKTGNWISVQKKALGKMKCGGKTKKGK
jgi:hypothetical protein